MNVGSLRHICAQPEDLTCSELALARMGHGFGSLRSRRAELVLTRMRHGLGALRTRRGLGKPGANKAPVRGAREYNVLSRCATVRPTQHWASRGGDART